MNHTKAEQLAASLLGATPDLVMPVIGVGGKRLFRVCTSRGHFILKLYETGDGSGPETFARETRALSFLATTALADRVPVLLTTDQVECAALLEWVTGEVPAPRYPGEIGQLQQFLQTLLAVSRGPIAAAFPARPDACATPADLARQIEARRARLGEVTRDAGLILWLARFDSLWDRVRVGLLAPQDPARLILAPSDLGFHNAWRRSDGRLVFFDFEQFGWDDPVRVVADLLWHPGSAITPAEAGAIYATAQAAFGSCDGGFPQRFARAWPAIGLRRTLGVLDEFLPENAERHRRWQDADAALRAATKRCRLAKAEAWIGRVEDCLQEAAA